MDYSPPGSSVYWISQARIQEWVVVSSPWGSSQPGDWTHVSFIAGGFFPTEQWEKPQKYPIKKDYAAEKKREL